MKGYNKYPEISLKMSKEEQEDEEEEYADGTKEKIKFGSEDSSISSSSVPCGGCGAHLHCQVICLYSFTLYLTKNVFHVKDKIYLKTFYENKVSFTCMKDTNL